MIAVLYLSFGFAQLSSTRGTLAYVSYSYPEFGQSAFIFNDIVALLLGGVVPLLFYELITAFSARFVTIKVGEVRGDLKYALRFFYIGANIVIGALKFLYYISPIVSVFGNVLIDFVVTTAFFAGYLAYVMKRYTDKTRWGVLLLSAGGTYVVVQALITVVNIISGVLA